MPGAGGLTMTNYLYNQAPKDGTEIGEPQNGAVFEKLFQTLFARRQDGAFRRGQIRLDRQRGSDCLCDRNLAHFTGQNFG